MSQHKTHWSTVDLSKRKKTIPASSATFVSHHVKSQRKYQSKFSTRSHKVPQIASQQAYKNDIIENLDSPGFGTVLISPNKPQYNISPQNITPNILSRSHSKSSRQKTKRFMFPSGGDISIKSYDYDTNDSESIINTEYTNDNEIDNSNNINDNDAEDMYCITVKCDHGQRFSFSVSRYCTILEIRQEIDDITNQIYPLNRTYLYYNGKQLKDNYTLKKYKIKNNSIVGISMDPIHWTSKNVSNWLANLGYEEFHDDHWTEKRIDGAELLLNIRPGHLYSDCGIDNRDDIKFIMKNIEFLRNRSTCFYKEMMKRKDNQIGSLKSEVFNKTETAKQLTITNNILKINLRNKCDELNEYEIEINKLKQQIQTLKQQQQNKYHDTTDEKEDNVPYTNDRMQHRNTFTQFRTYSMSTDISYDLEDQYSFELNGGRIC